MFLSGEMVGEPGSDPCFPSPSRWNHLVLFIVLVLVLLVLLGC